MLKFIKHHMETIVGIEVFPIVSLLIFFIFFTILIVYTIKMDKGFVSNMKDAPLEDITTPQND